MNALQPALSPSPTLFTSGCEVFQSSIHLVMTLDMDNVEVFDTGVKGRGLRTTKDLCAGEVVLAEPSFAAVVFDR